MLRLTVLNAAPRSDVRLNAKAWAKPFTARLLEPGLVSYKDVGAGIAILRKPTIDRCVATFVGRPLTVYVSPRGNFVHHLEDTTPANMKEIGHGYMTEVFYNVDDGWWCCRGIADTDEAVEAIQAAGKCSVGYKVLRTGPGGEDHGVKFDEEILEFEGEHLAVVTRPRYEGATIRLNAKAEPESKNTMRLLFWKKTPPASGAATPAAGTPPAVTPTPEHRENGATDISPDSEIEIPGAPGQTATKVTLGELVSVYNGKDEVDDDDEVTLENGVKVKMSALKNAYNAAQARQNGTPEAPAPAVAPAPAGEAAPVAAPAPAPESRQNAGPDHFRLLSSAATAYQPPVVEKRFNSIEERLANGRRLYGSEPAKK